MTSDKGYLSADGTVSSKWRPESIARISYSETQYNLRRVYVTRTWRVTMLDDPAVRFEGLTRKAAIEKALARG